MRNFFLLLLLLLSPALFIPSHAIAAAPVPQQTFMKATVVEITKEGKKDIAGSQNLFQDLKLQILDGPQKDTILTLEHGGMYTISEQQKVQTGDTVIVAKTLTPDGKTMYSIHDTYRLSRIYPFLFAFFGLVVLMSGKKGLGAIVGMLISLLVIWQFLVPQILAGHDPLMFSIISAIIIMIITMYLAHGFSAQTTVAIGATCVSLIATGLLAVFFVQSVRLSGLGSDDMVSLQQMFGGKINFQGLLLGGIIIGALGVLDDVTSTQTATINELAKANPNYTVTHLIQKGLTIGKEHITSLVNTLVLAYAGASIGVFIYMLLGVQNHTLPLWVILNSEMIIEEIVRTLAGSTGLILAVPITTVFAAFFAKYDIRIK